jgi:hypothetical protein
MATALQQSHLGKVTPSEKRAIEYYSNPALYKILHLARSNGGYLLIYVDRIDVSKTKKHDPPFKYFRAVVNKWGKVITRYSGNVWSAKYKDIIDDFTRVDNTRH